MRTIKFTKMQAAGNDFIVTDETQGLTLTSSSVQRICDRKYGIGADGLLVIGKSKTADARMRIFNADGSQAQMCGNGARCAALYIASAVSLRGSPAKSGTTKQSFFSRHSRDPDNSSGKIASQKPLAMTPHYRLPNTELLEKISIETKAGIIHAEVKGENVKIKLPDPIDLKLAIPLQVDGKHLSAHFVNTGVPHTIVFAGDLKIALDKIDVAGLGRKLRYHKQFAPEGTNVDFVEISGPTSIKVRTYERGVEAETLACGTGAAACAIVSIAERLTPENAGHKISVQTKGSEILKVSVDQEGNDFKNLWLQGKAETVYKGMIETKLQSTFLLKCANSSPC